MVRITILLSIIIPSIILVSCTGRADRITKKWKVIETTVSGQKIDGDLVNGFYIDIKKDGTYLLNGMGKEAGRWILSDDSDSLITINEKNRRVAYYISELNDQKLILLDNSEGASATTMFEASNN